MRVRWLAKLGQDLISSRRPSRFDLPSQCLASMALSVNPSLPKVVSSSFIFATRSHRNQPPGLGFYPPSPLLPVGQACLYAAKERSSVSIIVWVYCAEFFLQSCGNIMIIRPDQCLLDSFLLLLQAIATIDKVTILDCVLGVWCNSCFIEEFIRINSNLESSISL